MGIETALTRMFGLRYPLIQAPMAGAAGGALAREVARSGGLGMIGTGSLAAIPWLNEQWAQLTAPHPVGIGFLSWALDARPEQRELLDYSLTLRPAAILLSFGDPRPYIPAIHAAGSRAICQVQTAADAAAAVEAGADLLVAQGTESGGHTGRIPLRQLLAEVLPIAGSTPVAVAGGIATGHGVTQAIAIGACGAMLGTRFVATPESLYHDRAKERILAATAADTVLTRVFDLVQGIPWPAQFGGRALCNDFTRAWHGQEERLLESLPVAQEGYQRARQIADYGTLVTYAGESVGQISEILPAAEVVARIGAEMAEDPASV